MRNAFFNGFFRASPKIILTKGLPEVRGARYRVQGAGLRISTFSTLHLAPGFFAKKSLLPIFPA
jgi:hypothetical protein